MGRDWKTLAIHGLEKTKNGVSRLMLLNSNDEEKAYTEKAIFEPKYGEDGEFIPSIFHKAYEFNRPNEARKRGVYPYFRSIADISDDETEVVLGDGTRCLMFGSNSYWGLTKDSRVVEDAVEATRRFGTGTAGSRFLNGNTILHDELETKLAEFVGKPAALLFSTGYQANLGFAPIISSKRRCLENKYVFSDTSNHASILAGIILSQSRMIRFKHNDIRDLERRLLNVPHSAEKLVVADGVFSMEGDILNLPEICKLKEKYNFGIMVDDAHSIGILGDGGRGTANHFGLTNKVDMIMGTFSKTYASIGGYIASDRAIIDFLRHESPSQIFSAGSPASQIAATLRVLEIIKTEPERMACLWKNTERMKNGLISLRYKVGNSQTPILPVYTGGQYRTLVFSKRLEEEGVFVNPIVSPAVKQGEELIRISLMATHNPKQIDFALDKMAKVGKELSVI